MRLAASGLLLLLFAFGVQSYTTVRLEEEVVDYLLAVTPIESSMGELARIEAIVSTLGAFCVPRREYADSTKRPRDHQFLNASPILSSIAYGGGACGYATEVGVRTFQKAGFRARFVQVQGENGTTRHVVMDVETSSQGFVVIDPIFGWAFFNRSGQPYSYAELAENWHEIRDELPASKIRQYSYSYGVEHTNWEKNLFIASFGWALDAFGIDKEYICLRIWYNYLRRAGGVLAMAVGFLGLTFQNRNRFNA